MIPDIPSLNEASKIDLSGVYIIVGFLIISNIGTIVTTVIALVRGVYRFAIVESKTEALHKRQDEANEKVNRLETLIHQLMRKDD